MISKGAPINFEHEAIIAAHQAAKQAKVARRLNAPKVKAARAMVKLPKQAQVTIQEPAGGVVGRARPKGMGRGQGEMVSELDPVTLKHERAHLAPKRNSMRFAERLQEPRRRGREEARASHLAGHSGSYGRAFSDPKKEKEFRYGFNEVTAKMKRAGTKVQKRWLDAFGIEHT